MRLVATGGTISNRTGGRLTAEELVKSMSGVERYARPEFEQFSNLASSELTLDHWLGIARRLNELFTTEPEIAGLVVTSGTDTLEELAYFLNLSVRSEKPVVVVGSMRNPSTLGYEGAANLLEGFRVAASPEARGKGVLVVLNDEINAAREVTKTDALRLSTFQTRGYGVLGVVDADRVVFYRTLLKRHTARSEFDVSSLTRLPRVDVILVYQGADGDLIKAAADAGAQGNRHRERRRRGDERHAAGGDHVRAQEGRAGGDDDASGERADRAAQARPRCAAARERQQRRRQRVDAGGAPEADRGRGPLAGEGARPPDAGAVEDAGPERGSADVLGILTALRPGATIGIRLPRNDLSVWASSAVGSAHEWHS